MWDKLILHVISWNNVTTLSVTKFWEYVFGEVTYILTPIFTHSLTPWSRVFEMLRVSQPAKQFTNFMEPKSLLPRSQQPATCRSNNPHIYLLYPTPFYYLKINFNITLPSMPTLSKWPVSPKLPTNTLRHLEPLFSHIHATYPNHPSLLDLMTWILFGDECKLWSSPFLNFLQSPVTPSLLDPTIFLKVLFSNTLWETKFHTH